MLSTQNLCKYFSVTRRNSLFSLKPNHTTVKAVNQVNIDVQCGENYAIVGESGSGKSTLGYVLARVLDSTSGTIWFNGKDLTNISGRELKELRQMVQMVVQDPGTSLNPRQTIESTVSLPLKIHTILTKKEIREKVVELLEAVNLPAEIMPRYPGELSGGQKQRVNLARALSLNPELLILDEPTSALDVSVQAKILDLLTELKQRLGLTYILITHDLSIVKNISDTIAVMYLGRVIEVACTSDIFERPMHPYTKALISAIPIITKEEKELIPKEITLEGEIPSPSNVPHTCPFLSRCQEKKGICEKAACPDLKEVEKGHFVRCLL